MTAPPPHAISIRPGTPADAAVLTRLAATSYADTFLADNDEQDMALFMAEAFHEDVQRAELADARRLVLLAEHDGEAVGYAMLREGPAPGHVGEVDAIEIARLYVDRRWIGAGVGASLMQRCLEEAEHRGRRVVWLGVWEHNPRAIAFYRRWGFVKTGTQPYQLGRDLQTDHVMARPVAREG